ncbi:MAG: SUMF1/EgtB/PvdO family nonheme iron enzyme [Cyclobacteriaceae bacterium]
MVNHYLFKTEAQESEQTFQTLENPGGKKAEVKPLQTRRFIVIPFVVIVIGGVGIYVFQFVSRLRDAEEVKAKIVALERLVEDVQNESSVQRGLKSWNAYQILKEAEKEYPYEKEKLSKIVGPVSRVFQFKSNVPNTEVFIKPYSNPKEDWVLIGRTPIDGAKLPAGCLRLKIVKEGYADQEDVIEDRNMYETEKEIKLDFKLIAPASIPQGMVLVHSDTTGKYENGVVYEDFFVDKYEVTNVEYKKFVDAGGYRNKKYWRDKFINDGKEISWETVMTLFVDKTGQVGPSSWVAGSFAEGEEQYPVRGISWYEASAYSEYVGKRLLTLEHFGRLATYFASAEIVNLSNIESAKVKPVGTSDGMTRHGTFDLAGNAREWIYNKVEGSNDHFVLGGAWSDNSYYFGQDQDLAPMDRSELNGFRCMKPLDSTSSLLLSPIKHFVFDMSKRKIMTEAQYELVKHLYDYEQKPVKARTLYVKEEPDWVKEKVMFPSVYGSDSVIVYLYLPKKVKAPYQSVMYFPGSGAFSPINSEDFFEKDIKIFQFLIRTGRAVICPVYYSTLDRYDPSWLQTSYTNPRQGLISRKEIVIKAGKDFKRTVDYITTRKDLDPDRIAYFGFSQGGGEGAIMLAIESRIKTAALAICGISTRIEIAPEIDRVNYLPRVHQPVLMLNSRYDWNFPYELAQKPFFELLGTPPTQKKLILFEESGHQIPMNAVIKETLKWYNQHLGSVTPAL